MNVLSPILFLFFTYFFMCMNSKHHVIDLEMVKLLRIHITSGTRCQTNALLQKYILQRKFSLRGGLEDTMANYVPSREELDKGLECTMCLNFLCAPRTLPCGHSFCEPCVLSWLRTGQRICPLCRSSISSATECGLSTNFALELACRYLYGTEYGRRLKELDDLKLIPSKVVSAPISLTLPAVTFSDH